MEYRRILITRTDRIGDVVLSLPMLAVIRRKFPHAQISMLVRQYTLGLVEGHRYLDIALTLEGLGSWWSSYRRVRKEHYDVVVFAFPRFWLAILFFAARVPIRIGTGYRWYSFLFNKRVYEHRKDARYHELEYDIHLLEPLGCNREQSRDFLIPVGDKERQTIRNFFDEFQISPNDRVIVLHAGSGGSARDWPVERFALVGRRFLERGMKVILTGSREEQPLVSSVHTHMGDRSINAVGRFSLRELAALYEKTDVVVANSTGPIHIAAAMGTPVVGFYPPIIQCSSARWGPYTDKRIIFEPDKSRCPECPRGPCRSSLCMEQITVDDVEKGVLLLLEKYSHA